MGSVIALPDFPRYRDLHAETAGHSPRRRSRSGGSTSRNGPPSVTTPKWYRARKERARRSGRCRAWPAGTNRPTPTKCGSATTSRTPHSWSRPD